MYCIPFNNYINLTLLDTGICYQMFFILFVPNVRKLLNSLISKILSSFPHCYLEKEPIYVSHRLKVLMYAALLLQYAVYCICMTATC